MQKIFILIVLICAFQTMACNKDDNQQQSGTNSNTKVLYTMPEESEQHEGTWLQWPHHYQYGITFRDRLDDTWVSITKHLSESEKVYIIVYDETEKSRVTTLLQNSGIPMLNISFDIYPTDDFWVRDNGPIYVRDSAGKLHVEDWGFNGWGNKAAYEKCNTIPSKIATKQGYPVIDLNNIMTNEGGSVEIDGNGTMMACKSSILNKNRNPNMSQEKAEEIFTKYLGVTKFIWLDGVAGLEITDMHIDGFARFLNKATIVTMEKNDLVEWEVPESDIEKLYTAKNKENNTFNIVKLPLSKNNVITTYGKNLGYKGSYINYYIANSVVLVPNYNDPNDAIANNIIQQYYPNRKVIGIDCRNLYANGGMIHCVTQQQPK